MIKLAVTIFWAGLLVFHFAAWAVGIGIVFDVIHGAVPVWCK